MAGMACIATANDCSLVQCCRLCDRSQMAGLGRRRSLASRPDVLRMFFLSHHHNREWNIDWNREEASAISTRPFTAPRTIGATTASDPLAGEIAAAELL